MQFFLLATSGPRSWFFEKLGSLYNEKLKIQGLFCSVSIIALVSLENLGLGALSSFMKLMSLGPGPPSSFGSAVSKIEPVPVHPCRARCVVYGRQDSFDIYWVHAILLAFFCLVHLTLGSHWFCITALPVRFTSFGYCSFENLRTFFSRCSFD